MPGIGFIAVPGFSILGRMISQVEHLGVEHLGHLGTDGVNA